MSSIKLWWKAVRPFAFSASATPAALGAVMAAAVYPDLTIEWIDFFLVILGSMLVHAGTNLINDYYDFKCGVDREGTYGSSGLLVGKIMKPEQTLKGAVICFASATVFALYFILTAVNPWIFIIICSISLISGIMYTFAPVALKYHALGDIQVFLFMGIIITSGSFYVQTQEFSWIPVFFSIPVGLLVDAILHSNNYRDIGFDRNAGIATLAIKLGEKGSRALYYFLVLGAYITIVVLILFANLHPVALLTFLSLPIALKLASLAGKKGNVPIEKFATIDIQTAQLHMLFGVLFIISFVIQILFLSNQS